MSIVIVGQAITGIAVVVLILLQNRSGGAGSAFGGGGGGGGDFLKTRRGSEKILFIATIALTLIFTILSIINLILQ